MDKLTLEHLAPYLPYGLKVITIDGEKSMVSIHADDFVVGCTNSIDCCFYDFTIKPILRHLSDIDLKFFQDNMHPDLEDFRINCEPENDHFSVEVCDKVLGWSAISYEEYQLFFKNHVDIFGLIDAGLAVDINTLEGGSSNGY